MPNPDRVCSPGYAVMQRCTGRDFDGQTGGWAGWLRVCGGDQETREESGRDRILHGGSDSCAGRSEIESVSELGNRDRDREVFFALQQDLSGSERGPGCRVLDIPPPSRLVRFYPFTYCVQWPRIYFFTFVVEGSDEYSPPGLRCAPLGHERDDVPEEERKNRGY